MRSPGRPLTVTKVTNCQLDANLRCLRQRCQACGSDSAKTVQRENGFPFALLTAEGERERALRAAVRYAERDLTSTSPLQGKEPVASTNSLSQAPSLRDSHKNQTLRARIARRVTEAVAKQGYDATTIEEIADKAGVSTRTFFRYFPTKEDVLYHGERDWVQTAIDAYPAQPTTLNDLDAMRVTLETLAPRLEKSHRALGLYQRAVESSPTLRSSEHDHQRESTDVLAQAIATRRGQPRAPTKPAFCWPR